MGRPQSESIDKYITYPLVYSFVPYFHSVHPIWITLVCIATKYISLLLLSYRYYPVMLTTFLLLERGLDCLDGEVARYYDKCTTMGHYLDKYSDVIFRLYMVKECLWICFIAPYINIWSILLFMNCFICPGVYVYDYLKGNMKSDMITDKKCYSLVLEDNATLICFILPIIISFIP